MAIGLVLDGAPDTPSALRRYERVRSARTRRLVARGRRAAWVTTTRNSTLIGLRTALIRLVPAGRMAALFMLAERQDPHRELR